MTLTIGSLFSGAGMLDVAVQAVFGGDIAWHSENNAAASKVLTHHWPNVPNHGDITQIDWTTIEPVDIICGGWPCQPFSLAGKRKGVNDERALWPEVARAVRVVRPRFVILENVAAIFGPEFHRVANSLAALGYDMRWLCLRASAVGAPHHRERVFIVAHPADELCPSVSASDNAEALGAARFGAGDRAGAGDSAARVQQLGGSAGSVCAKGIELLPTCAARDYTGHGPSQMKRHSPNVSAIVDLLTLVECEQQEEDSQLSLLPTPTSADTGGGLHPDRREGHTAQLIDYALLSESRWGKYTPAIARWEQLTRLAPAPTDLSINGNPRLAAAFSEWMMGWPLGWVTKVPNISRANALRIIGNGVVPQQAAAALRILAGCL